MTRQARLNITPLRYTDMAWTRSQKIGAPMMVIGILLCFTLIGAILGIPMALYGARLWRKGEQAD